MANFANVAKGDKIKLTQEVTATFASEDGFDYVLPNGAYGSVRSTDKNVSVKIIENLRSVGDKLGGEKVESWAAPAGTVVEWSPTKVLYVRTKNGWLNTKTNIAATGLNTQPNWVVRYIAEVK